MCIGGRQTVCAGQDGAGCCWLPTLALLLLLLLLLYRETTEGLGRLIAKELKPGLAEHVDLSEEENAFTGVASQCLSVLVLGINTHLDGCLQV